MTDIKDEGLIQPGQWLQAICPICTAKYLHIEQYKPASCQRTECALKVKQGV